MPEPIPGLSGAQIEALRALYAQLQKHEPGRDEDVLKAKVMDAVKLLNPSFTPTMNEEVTKD
jgi:hypothetical protein